MLRRPLLLPLLALLPSTPLLPPAALILAETRSLYLEDALPPRPIADVHARLLRVGQRTFLELTLSPCGAGVEPLPGLLGVPGTNLRTAEELERLLADDALQLVTRDGAARHSGTLARVERRPLPARIVDTAGRVHAATTAASWPVSVVFRSAALPPRATCSHLECDGLPRLAVHADATSSPPTLHIESLGEPAAQPRVEAPR